MLYKYNRYTPTSWPLKKISKIALWSMSHVCKNMLHMASELEKKTGWFPCSLQFKIAE